MCGLRASSSGQSENRTDVGDQGLGRRRNGGRFLASRKPFSARLTSPPSLPPENRGKSGVKCAGACRPPEACRRPKHELLYARRAPVVNTGDAACCPVELGPMMQMTAEAASAMTAPCPKCATTMILAAITPHPIAAQMQRHTFLCTTCNQTKTYMLPAK